MSYNQTQTRQFLISAFSDRNIKFEIHDFESGCSMIDIWHRDRFHVIQLEANSVGLSTVSKDSPGFDTIPDERFADFEKFREKLLALIT
jgi:hypothetical protein